MLSTLCKLIKGNPRVIQSNGKISDKNYLPHNFSLEKANFYSTRDEHNKPPCEGGIILKVPDDFTGNKLSISNSKLLRENPKFNIGQDIHNFIIRERAEIDEYNAIVIKLEHNVTNAQVIHIQRDDLNNVFCIQFRTTPRDSTGVSHILEHVVLCGSKLYPIRDVFFKMRSRSLATFMNALTAPDFTMYPFSTQNPQDFHNLQKIYLDAVFRPHMKELDFMQEGWRLEPLDFNNIRSKPVIKGVVFNEMKGAFSDNDRILCQKIQNFILPSHTYSFISGGSPLKIPNLTWEELILFHKNHYHPSNARIYIYGNFPLPPTLKYLDKEYFSKYEYIDMKHTFIPPEHRWVKPVIKHIQCRRDNIRTNRAMEHWMTVTLLMNDTTNIYETFELQLLSELMIHGLNSPFYKSMIEPSFSGGYCACTGYQTHTKEAYFTIGLQRIKKADIPKVVDIFNHTLESILKTGFDQNQVDPILHKRNLNVRHVTPNFGMDLLYKICSVINHDGDVVKALSVNSLINEFKKNLKSDPKYLQMLVEKHFVKNSHRLLLSMSPDKDFDKKLKKHERKIAMKKWKHLLPAERDDLLKKCFALLKQQTSSQKTDVLPTLNMSDISEKTDDDYIKHAVYHPVLTQINKVETNNLVYFRGIFNCSNLEPEQRMLLPLFCYVIPRVGVKKMNFRDFETFVNLKTSGINCAIHIADNPIKEDSYEVGIEVTSFCLENNASVMFDLWCDIFSEPDFSSVQRFKLLLELYVVNMAKGIFSSGHLYAMRAAASLITTNWEERNNLLGLGHVSHMKRLMNMNIHEALLKEMNSIAELVFDKSSLRCCLNLQTSSMDKTLNTFENFINKLPGKSVEKPSQQIFTDFPHWLKSNKIQCQHYVFDAPIYFCSKAILTAPFMNPDHCILHVLSKILSLKYLHPELRRKQGAYGGGSVLTDCGAFCFFSYRDPRHLQTLDVFDQSSNWLQSELSSITDQELLEAKLGVFQVLDIPVPPSLRGVYKFSRGINNKMLTEYKIGVKKVNQMDLKVVSEKYFGEKAKVKISKIILGAKHRTMNFSKRHNETWTIVEEN